MNRQANPFEDLRRSLLHMKAEKTRNERVFIVTNVASLVQALRASAGHSQRGLANYAGMGQSEISRVENAGGTRAPELATLVRIARVCGYELAIMATRLGNVITTPLNQPARKVRKAKRKSREVVNARRLRAR
jgi:transcriptional regulator with XRE-family HTH domain